MIIISHFDISKFLITRKLLVCCFSVIIFSMATPEEYFQRRHTLIDQATPLVMGGVVHRAEVYEAANGRRHICFLKEPERATTASSRLGVFIDPTDSTISLLGMIVNNEFRGSGAGKAIARYFLDYAGINELKPIHTSVIRKPVIALTLARTGFTPEEGGVLVGLLPNDNSSSSACPRISPINPSILPPDVIDRSPAGKFYEVMDESTVARNYPVFDPFTPVTIHTKYQPPAI